MDGWGNKWWNERRTIVIQLSHAMAPSGPDVLVACGVEGFGDGISEVEC